VNSKKKLKTYNITFRPDADNRYNTKTVAYKANNIKDAERMFYAEHPEQKAERYLEIHSPLSNYAIDAEKKKSAEISNKNTISTTTTTMKNFNIQNTFKLINEYVQTLTLLLVSLIPLLLLGVILFGDDFMLGNVVVYNIQNILDSMAGFVGIITLLLIVNVYSKIHKKN
jgi:hypothetical protein